MGADNTIMTGAIPNGGSPDADHHHDKQRPALWGGFLVIGEYHRARRPAFILDTRWRLRLVVRRRQRRLRHRMSYDGQYMWIDSANVRHPGRPHAPRDDGRDDRHRLLDPVHRA